MRLFSILCVIYNVKDVKDKMLKKLDCMSRRTIDENPYWSYNMDEYRRPDDAIGKYYYVDSPGSVMIIPITEAGKFVLAKQYRYLNGKESLEFPGGGKKANMSYLQNAQAELKEEIGGVGELEYLGAFNPCNGITNEICEVYIGKSINLTPATPDDSEEIEIVELSANEMKDKILSGEIWDGMTIACFSYYLMNNKY